MQEVTRLLTGDKDSQHGLGMVTGQPLPSDKRAQQML